MTKQTTEKNKRKDIVFIDVEPLHFAKYNVLCKTENNTKFWCFKSALRTYKYGHTVFLFPKRREKNKQVTNKIRLENGDDVTLQELVKRIGNVPKSA